MITGKALQEKAYDDLKEMILNGQLAQGQIYSETRISSELGISRTPLKDALVRLEQERYVDILPSRGFCLHEMSRQDIQTTYQARTAIEGFCALTLAAGRETEEGQRTVRQLANCLEEMKCCLTAGAPMEQMFEHDLAFHRAMVRFSGNSELISLFERYNHRLSMIAIKSLEHPGRAGEALAEHQQVYDTIMAAGTDPQSKMEVYFSILHHMEASRDLVLTDTGN